MNSNPAGKYPEFPGSLDDRHLMAFSERSTLAYGRQLSEIPGERPVQCQMAGPQTSS